MSEMDQWLTASIEVLRTAFAPNADAAARQRGATVCLSLHAMLSPSRIVPFAPVPQHEPAEPDLIEMILARVAPFLSSEPIRFNPSPASVLPAVNVNK